MGLRSRPAGRLARLMPSWAKAAVTCALLAALAAAAAAPAHAQTLNEKLAGKARAKPPGAEPDKMLLQAKELVYNRDKNQVSAVGEVRVYYQGRTLQADKVIYDRNTNRVFATGNSKMTDADGTVTYAERFDLTDDFKDGFIDSLKADTANKTHFTAARAERTAGETTVFDKGIYTACDACKEDPSRPPLWQVRAKRIIHKGEEHTVYYEDASLEFFGFPVAYLPYFSTPDAQATRASGFLTPHYVFKTALGYGAAVPYFLALAPNYDLTVTPTYFSLQGLLGQVEWRHRVLNGSYSVRAAGIFQQDTAQFNAAPFGPGSRVFRGSIDTTGQFNINSQWRFGWTASVSTDKWFTTDYREPPASLTTTYFSETISTAYLNGQGQRGYFDLRGYYIQGRNTRDVQKQQPVVLPLLDYNKTFDLNPKSTGGIGGQIEVDLNATAVRREVAAFQSTGARALDKAFGVYDICDSYTPGATSGKCLLRGVGGDYARATLNLSWKRKFIDPIGQVWTPFVFARFNGQWLNLNTTNVLVFNSIYGNSVIPNSAQTSFVNGSSGSFSGDVVPGAGVEYRYPFIAQTSWATHVFEPIAQVIVRPSSSGNRQINEDAQSLVFDDTNLFEWSKYSGYDRFEGGVRANYGAQYTMNLTNGGYANVLAGQSFQLAGRNSYATADAANVGISSGLDTRRSDYIARAAVSPFSDLSFIAKGRFDEGNFTMRRFDASVNANVLGLATSLQYARYLATPALGYDKRREGLSASARYNFLEHYFIDSSVSFDLSRHLTNPARPLFSVAAFGLGVGYDDNCTNFSLRYVAGYTDSGGTTRTRSQTVLFELKLRTLGDTKVKTSLGSTVVTDGL